MLVRVFKGASQFGEALYGVSATYCCISSIRVALALKLDSEVSFN
jgi:hypothetical protein